MLKMFEKFINEHGSSKILRERLELFSDKYSMLEERLKVSEHKNMVLDNENEILKSQLSQSRIKVDKLKVIIETNTEIDNEKMILP